MYKHGIICTKAWPFHRGHEHLIKAARAQCDKITVIVVYGEGQSPDGKTRASWVRQTFPDIQVKCVCDIFTDDSNPLSSKLWAIYARDIMEGEDFDVVFTSEPYGQWWAELMGVKSVQVDTRRTLVPISGTKIRNDPYLHWQYINHYAKLTYLKRVLVVGAESTGKTSLCTQLANLYGTFFVPEYGRLYVEQFKNFNDLTEAHRRVIFGQIVNKQPELERQIEQDARLLCFYDTDLFTTSLFYEQWQPDHIGDRLHKTILEQAKITDRYDLVLVLKDDVPAVQDGMREQNTEQRAAVTQRLLTNYGERAILLQGPWFVREKDAIRSINALFQGSQVTLPQSFPSFDPFSSLRGEAEDYS